MSLLSCLRCVLLLSYCVVVPPAISMQRRRRHVLFVPCTATTATRYGGNATTATRSAASIQLALVVVGSCFVCLSVWLFVCFFPGVCSFVSLLTSLGFGLGRTLSRLNIRPAFLLHVCVCVCVCVSVCVCV